MPRNATLATGSRLPSRTQLRVVLLFWAVEFVAITIQRSLIDSEGMFALLTPRFFTALLGIALSLWIAAALANMPNGSWKARIATAAALAAACALLHAAGNFAIFQLFLGEMNWRLATAANYGVAMAQWLWIYGCAAMILLVLAYAAELRTIRESIQPPRAPETPEIWIRHHGEAIRLALDGVDRISAERQYVRIFKDGRSWLHRASLTNLSPMLDDGRFIRIHRSHILARHSVAAVQRTPHGDYRVTTTTGEQFPVGRNYRAAVRAMMTPTP